MILSVNEFLEIAHTLCKCRKYKPLHVYASQHETLNVGLLILTDYLCSHI